MLKPIIGGYGTMGCPNFVEKTFTGGSKTAKFMKVFFLESLPLYSIWTTFFYDIKLGYQEFFVTRLSLLFFSSYVNLNGVNSKIITKLPKLTGLCPQLKLT